MERKDGEPNAHMAELDRRLEELRTRKKKVDAAKEGAKEANKGLKEATRNYDLQRKRLTEEVAGFYKIFNLAILAFGNRSEVGSRSAGGSKETNVLIKKRAAEENSSAGRTGKELFVVGSTGVSTDEVGDDDFHVDADTKEKLSTLDRSLEQLRITKKILVQNLKVDSAEEPEKQKKRGFLQKKHRRID